MRWGKRRPPVSGAAHLAPWATRPDAARCTIIPDHRAQLRSSRCPPQITNSHQRLERSGAHAGSETPCTPGTFCCNSSEGLHHHAVAASRPANCSTCVMADATQGAVQASYEDTAAALGLACRPWYSETDQMPPGGQMPTCGLPPPVHLEDHFAASVDAPATPADRFDSRTSNITVLHRVAL